VAELPPTLAVPAGIPANLLKLVVLTPRFSSISVVGLARVELATSSLGKCSLYKAIRGINGIAGWSVPNLRWFWGYLGTDLGINRGYSSLDCSMISAC
jgi:hypothetical protein